MFPFPTVLSLLWWAYTVQASVTVYGVSGQLQQTLGLSSNTSSPSTVTTTADIPAYTPPAFNTVVLQAPPVPQPPPPTQFSLSLQASTGAGVQGLSIPQSGSFLGFSVEFSVVNQVVGINSSFIQVPFLNLMSLLTARAGRVTIRVGGNSQETASLVAVGSLAGGKAIEKDKDDTSNPTQTPALLFTPEIIYMLANVSALVNTKWYLGIPFNDTSNLRLGIAEVGEAILGDNLLGFQVANEPDLYAGHGNRPATYSQTDFFNEFGIAVQAISADALIPLKNNLIAPSVATGPWTPESVWDTGFVGAYTNSLGALSVEHYPDDNCAAAFPNSGFGAPKDPQTVFPNYLNHTSGIDIISIYLNSTGFAQANGKPFLMMETNTASCGGFPGVSDSFGAALWALDYGMQMAYSNFSGALLHVGGVSDTYNPFTPPPTNMSAFAQWTVGPVFYAAVIVAEAFGPSNTSQIVDLQANGDNIYTPAYAIYEGGSLARVALFNYVTDPSGASDYTVDVGVVGGAVPAEISVKYLLAPSVAEKTNITWAGQTLSGTFQSDGRFRGAENVVSVPCDQGANTCSITVPAPGFALVFLTDEAFSESDPSSTVTFPTTSLTKTQNTAAVPASVLATSNGQSGAEREQLGSTSKGSASAAQKMVLLPGAAALGTALAGVVVLLSALRR